MARKNQTRNALIIIVVIILGILMFSGGEELFIGTTKGTEEGCLANMQEDGASRDFCFGCELVDDAFVSCMINEATQRNVQSYLPFTTIQNRKGRYFYLCYDESEVQDLNSIKSLSVQAVLECVGDNGNGDNGGVSDNGLWVIGGFVLASAGGLYYLWRRVKK